MNIREKLNKKSYPSGWSEEFKKDLFEELKIENHPKKEVLFRLAWEFGHAYGYSSVFYFAEEMVELLQ